MHWLGQVMGALLFGLCAYAGVRVLFWILRLLLADRPCAVYHLPDLYGDILYVGMAYHPDERLRRHKYEQALKLPDDPRKWWPRLALSIQESMTVPDECVTWYVNKAAAHEAEVADIRRMDPPGNRIKYKGVVLDD